MKPKVGTIVSLVDTGKQVNYPEMKGRVTFLKVTKLGTKYVYGLTLYYEETELKEASYESHFPLDKVEVLEGIREDLRQVYNDFKESESKWGKAEGEAYREAESKAWNLKSELMDAWRKEHPRPTLVQVM